MAEFKLITECRICGSSKLKQYLDLGSAPLANALLNSSSSRSHKYPLQVLFCEDCSLSQLSIVVNPNILYSDYPYHSSVSETFKKHCLDMAKSLKEMFTVEDPLVVDIASNDGCLLEQFKSCGYNVVGVEPSKNLVVKALKKGIPTLHDFWSEESSQEVYGADLITATNVFAHVDDLKGFLGGVKKALQPDGIFIIEVPYLYDLISKVQFDTIYHEHLSYFLLRPLKILFTSYGLHIFKVERHEIHGGSIRVFASINKRKADKSVREMEAFEKKEKLHQFKTYTGFAEKVEEIKSYFVELLEDLRRQHKKVMGYGASAKGAMLLSYCGVDSNHISSVVDDTKEKQGKYLPGSRIPIVDKNRLDAINPDYIALLAWNFSEEIIKRTFSHKARGVKYILPVPTVSVL